MIALYEFLDDLDVEVDRSARSRVVEIYIRKDPLKDEFNYGISCIIELEDLFCIVEIKSTFWVSTEGPTRRICVAKLK